MEVQAIKPDIKWDYKRAIFAKKKSLLITFALFKLVPKASVVGNDNTIVKRTWLDPQIELKAAAVKGGTEAIQKAF